MVERPKVFVTELEKQLHDDNERLRGALVMVTETVGNVPLVTAAAIKAALARKE